MNGKNAGPYSPASSIPPSEADGISAFLVASYNLGTGKISGEAWIDPLKHVVTKLVLHSARAACLNLRERICQPCLIAFEHADISMTCPVDQSPCDSG